MIKYPLAYNPILEYWEQIESGKEVACDKLYRTYKKIAYDLTDNTSQYYYSPKRANHTIEFFENYCHHSKGKMGGKPVILELWEKAMLATVFGFVDIDGNRKYREAVLIVGKKNGKSLISSGVGLYLLVADNEAGPEIYSVATKRDQAKIIWSEAKRMRNKSPALRKRTRALVSEILCDSNDGVFKPLASDSDTLDGLNVHGVLMDEWHQWKNGMALYNIMADGVSAREQPLIFATSTAGTVREDIYDIKYDYATQVINGYFDADGYKDDRFIAFIYELDNRKEWTDPKMWKKANPGLGTIKNEATLAEKVERAKKNPSMVKNLLCKEFNIRETSTEAWLSFETLNNTATYDIKALKPRYGIGGLDLSETTDLTCATVIFKVRDDPTLYVHQMYWLPAAVLDTRIKEDKIPYDKWLDQGWLRVSEGNKVNYKDVVAWFDEVKKDLDIYLYKGGYDRWNSQFIIDELKQSFGKSVFEEVIQGPKTMSSPMKNFAADLDAKKINYNNNPVLKWNLSNAAIKTDTNNNVSLVKTSQSRRRIDGVASLLDAYIVLERHYDDYMNLI
jgi:phage terminase large subunit-like protein